MSKITFSENQIEVLQCNPYVKRVTEKSITWIDIGSWESLNVFHAADYVMNKLSE